MRLTGPKGWAEERAKYRQFQGFPLLDNLSLPPMLPRVSPGEGIRLGLKLHYDGSGFFGWQAQKQERTVQGELEAAVTRLTGERRGVLGAGRTDRGVHASGQVAAVNVPARWEPAEFRRAANAVLPRDVWIEEARRVPDAFHPRYDAISRTYIYRIGLAEQAWSPFRRPWCWPLRGALEGSALDAAAAVIRGEHSFAAFAKAGQPERGERCHVHDAAWSRWADVGLTFTITANRYLHHMVRYLVGTMLDVARDRRPVGDMARLLEGSGSGLETSPPAPPEGLFLSRVEYPPEVWPVANHEPEREATTP
jgi:tRNA pseudouridine38-40 synthase